MLGTISGGKLPLQKVHLLYVDLPCCCSIFYRSRPVEIAGMLVLSQLLMVFSSRRGSALQLATRPIHPNINALHAFSACAYTHLESFYQPGFCCMLDGNGKIPARRRCTQRAMLSTLKYVPGAPNPTVTLMVPHVPGVGCISVLRKARHVLWILCVCGTDNHIQLDRNC